MASRYWVGSGSSTNWNAVGNTNWAATSGGANNQSVPGNTDDVFFDGNSGTGNSVISGTITVKSLDCTGYGGTITHNAAVNFVIAGNTFKLVSGMVYTLGSATTSALAFTSAAGTVSVDSGGKTFGNTTVQVVGTVQLVTNDLTLGAGTTLSLTAGTFTANNKGVSIGLWSSSNSSTRALTVGSGAWSITGNNGTVWDMGTLTGFTLTRGSAIQFTYAGATGTRTINQGASVGGTEANSIDVSVTAGTDTVTIANTGVMHDFNLTGFAGTLTNVAYSVYGNYNCGSTVTLSVGTNALSFKGTSGTQTITSNGITHDFPITFAGVGGTFQLASALTVGTTRTVVLTNGTLDSNNLSFTMGLFNGSGAATRVMTMGTSTWTLTGTGTVWNTTTTTNLTFTSANAIVTVNDTSATGKTFTTGGLTFGTIIYSGDNITITDAHTVSYMYVNTAGLTNGLKVTSSVIVTINGDFRTNGAVGSLAKLSSTIASSQHTLTAGPPLTQVCVDYMSIKDSKTTGANWRAGNNSTNVSNNNGWVFTSCPVKTNPPVNNKKNFRKRATNSTASNEIVGKQGFLLRKIKNNFISRFFHMFGR